MRLSLAVCLFALLAGAAAPGCSQGLTEYRFAGWVAAFPNGGKHVHGVITVAADSVKPYNKSTGDFSTTNVEGTTVKSMFVLQYYDADNVTLFLKGAAEVNMYSYTVEESMKNKKRVKTAGNASFDDSAVYNYLVPPTTKLNRKTDTTGTLLIEKDWVDSFFELEFASTLGVPGSFLSAGTNLVYSNLVGQVKYDNKLLDITNISLMTIFPTAVTTGVEVATTGAQAAATTGEQAAATTGNPATQGGSFVTVSTTGILPTSGDALSLSTALTPTLSASTGVISDVGSSSSAAQPGTPSAPAAADNSTASGVDTGLLGAIAGAIFLVVCCIVVALCLVRRRRQPPPRPLVESPPIELSQTSDSDDSLEESSSSASDAKDRVSFAAESGYKPLPVDIGPPVGSLPSSGVKHAAAELGYSTLPENASGNESPSQITAVTTAAGELDARFVIRFEDLQLEQELASGNFGVVFRGEYTANHCVVKQLKSKSLEARAELLREAVQLAQLRPHASICAFYGACLEPDKPFCLVTEYIEGGNLGTYLENPAERVRGRDVVNLSRDLAAGMTVLHRSNMLHLDLAARNLLVVISAEAPLKLRICDFGLSQTIPDGATSVSAEGCQIPWRWAAPEIMTTRVFDKASDVWAFGVCVYEFLSRSRPYADKPTEEVLAFVAGGGRLSRPDVSTVPQVFASKTLVDDLQSLMNRCWSASPDERPDFSSISKQLLLTLKRSDRELNTPETNSATEVLGKGDQHGEQYVAMYTEKDAVGSEHEYGKL